MHGPHAEIQRKNKVKIDSQKSDNTMWEKVAQFFQKMPKMYSLKVAIISLGKQVKVGSVIRWGDYLKFLATNFLSKLAQIFALFLGKFEKHNYF